MTAIKPTQRFMRLATIALASSLALTACGNKVEEMKKEQRAKMQQIQPEISVLTVQPERFDLLETAERSIDATLATLQTSAFLLKSSS